MAVGERVGRRPGGGSTRQRLRGVAMFRPLRMHNYRLYFAGQLVSLCGTWMQTTALAWLVLRLSDSGTVLGLVTAAQFVPTLVGGPFAGVLADRFDKRTTLIVAQSGLAFTAAALAALTLTDTITLPLLVALAVVLGAFTALDAPARQSFVTELVGREALPNAVGLNSALFNSARIVGPAIAGLLLSRYEDRVTLGVGLCFLVNAVSFAAVITSLALMRRRELLPSALVARGKGQIRDGFRYAMAEPTLRIILIITGIVGVFALNYQVLLPLVADKALGGTAGTLGALLVAMGAGSLVGSLVAASRGRSSMGLVVGACTAMAVSLAAATVAPGFETALVCWFFVGLTNMTFIAASNTTLQLTARPDMRGRVIALYFLMIMGSTPIGGPITGWIAQHLGTRYAVGLASAACFLAAGIGARSLRLGSRARADLAALDLSAGDGRPGDVAVEPRLAG